jgi:NADH:ubiquinone oxidoreductase subunit K
VEFITNNIEKEHYLLLASIIFGIGIIGILANRKSIINILMSNEVVKVNLTHNILSIRMPDSAQNHRNNQS